MGVEATALIHVFAVVDTIIYTLHRDHVQMHIYVHRITCSVGNECILENNTHAPSETQKKLTCLYCCRLLEWTKRRFN